MEKITWAICDDINFICESFELALKKYSILEYVGAAYSSDECELLCLNKKPDILLLDIQMEKECSGITAISRIKKVSPGTKIIMLTSYNDENYIFSSFTEGADNYILKSSSTDAIYTTMINLYNGQCTMEEDIMQLLVKQSKKIATRQQSLLYIITIMSSLSQSEFEILRAIYSGQTYKEIASSRFVETGTVKKQVSRILHKFNSKKMKDIIDMLSELNVFELYDSNNIKMDDINK